MADRVNVFEIPDWSFENDVNDIITWGRYFYYNVVSRVHAKRFSIYYSDDADIINGWFDSEVREFITLRLFDRSFHYDGLSSTKIRHAIVHNDMDYIKMFCPQAIADRMGVIRPYYLRVNENPKQDFSME